MTAYLGSLLNPESKTLQTRVLSGSMVLLTGSALATALNFIYNVAVAQLLGAAAFGHAIAVYTLLVLISAVTLSFQIVSAKVIAQRDSVEAKGNAYKGFHRDAWMAGIVAGLLLVLLRNVISAYLNLPSPVLILLLAIGVAFYVPLGARRGYLQGTCGFRELAINLVLEGFVRLTGSLLMIKLGFGVNGVIAANSGAVAFAYLFAIPKLPASLKSGLHVKVEFREGLQAIVFFVGQVLINNCDIVVVKHFFAPTSAGLYAAVALVGRVVFAFSWSVISTMFPVVAGSQREEGRRQGVLGTSMFLVFAIGAVIALGLRVSPASVWTTLFGSHFAGTQGHDLSFLLALYAATTCVYSLGVAVIAYEMSYKIANTSWVQLAFSAVLIAGIYRYHSSLEQVILVQLAMMTILLLIVTFPFLLNSFVDTGMGNSKVSSEFRVIRRVSENEVISEFLKNDFDNPKFKDYQSTLGDLVAKPNLDRERDNELRRALLFIRNGALWRELPKGTEWFEVEVKPADLLGIRAFPRAQWRKLARGNFGITGIARRVSGGECGKIAEQEFLSRIQQLRGRIIAGTAARAVLLIGQGATGPFTILDGNHRLLAALLISPPCIERFRFFCGLSPRMDECCWYETNFATLTRYGANMLRYVVHDPEAEVERLLQDS